MYPGKNETFFKWPQKEDIQTVDRKFIIYMLTHEEEPCPTANEARSYMITCSKQIEDIFNSYKEFYFC